MKRRTQDNGPWVFRDGKLVTKERAREIDARKTKKTMKLDFLPKQVERGSWVLIGNELVPKHEANRRRMEKALASKSDLPAPAIRPDTIEVRSMVNGAMFDSRSAYYKHLKDTGHHIMDDKEATYVPTPAIEKPEYKKQIQADIANALEKHEQGWVEPPIAQAADFNLDISKVDESGYVRAEGEAPVVSESV